MNVQLAIDSIVRQVTVLIAQMATSGGIRAPVAHIANQVFVELANELESQGVSRKVSADMFGMALRSYIRKLRRLTEGQTDVGRTLWQVMLDFVRNEEMVTRGRLLERFSHDDELAVIAVVRDLSESGLLFVSGSGAQAVYRAATDDELSRLSQLTSEQGFDELVWVHIYRGGPLSTDGLAALLSRAADGLNEAIERLVADGRVQRLEDGRLNASEFILPLGSAVGGDAAVFDHFQAMVQTICQRLSLASFGPQQDDAIGGSTYTFDVWSGHPMEVEVKAQLSLMREQLGKLRARVGTHNAASGRPEEYEQVVSYAGQCVIPRENQEDN